MYAGFVNDSRTQYVTAEAHQETPEPTAKPKASRDDDLKPVGLPELLFGLAGVGLLAWLGYVGLKVFLTAAGMTQSWATQQSTPGF